MRLLYYIYYEFVVVKQYFSFSFSQCALSVLVRCFMWPIFRPNKSGYPLYRDSLYLNAYRRMTFINIYNNNFVFFYFVVTPLRCRRYKKGNQLCFIIIQSYQLFIFRSLPTHYTQPNSVDQSHFYLISFNEK